MFFSNTFSLNFNKLKDIIPLLNAHLLVRFGDLKFGDSTEQAKMLFGLAEDTDESEAIDGSLSAVWHYWTKGFTLFFDGPNQDRFSSVEIDSSVPLKMWDIPVFSLNEAQLKQLFVQNGFKELDEERHEWGEKRITFEDAMADFYFENGIMASVSYSSSIPSESEINN